MKISYTRKKYKFCKQMYITKYNFNFKYYNYYTLRKIQCLYLTKSTKYIITGSYNVASNVNTYDIHHHIHQI